VPLSADQYRALNDVSWLYDDFLSQSNEDNQRIAFNAVLDILKKAGQLENELEKLRERIKNTPILITDLNAYLSPPPAPSEDEIKLRRQSKKIDVERKKQQEKDKNSWVEFKKNIEANPRKICNQQNPNAGYLLNLTTWLERRTKANDHSKAAKNWRLLEEAFGRSVAEAYRDGMKAIWRVTEPMHPERKEGNGIVTKWVTILSFSGLEIEAEEDLQWSSKLSNSEAERAALHGCVSEQGYPEWLDALIDSHPHITLPIIKQEIHTEWISTLHGALNFLYRYGSSSLVLSVPIQQLLFEVITDIEPRDLGRFDHGIKILKNLILDDEQKNKLISLSKRRFKRHSKLANNDYALRYLALLLLFDASSSIDFLEQWIDEGAEQKYDRAARGFSLLFDRHDPLIAGLLGNVSVGDLERLLRLVYSYIRPEDDIVHDGVYSPGTRDNAEGARNTILTALIERPGADAFRAMHRIASDPLFAVRATRFKELARSKAENDSELLSWSVPELLKFENEHTAPVKTGNDLLRVVLAVLNDIQFQLTQGEVSSRSLLEKAQDEGEVKNWLVEQMNYRSRGRFHAYREAEVSQGNKPDIIIASTSAQCEVAIEVKHGGMKWSYRDFEKALRKQLAEDYLKPITRRHGILLISHHGKRQFWQETGTKKKLGFVDLIQSLNDIARTLLENEAGPIEGKCFGIDATLVKPK